MIGLEVVGETLGEDVVGDIVGSDVDGSCVGIGVVGAITGEEVGDDTVVLAAYASQTAAHASSSK